MHAALQHLLGISAVLAAFCGKAFARIIAVRLESKGGKRKHIDAVAVLQHIEIAVVEADADRAGHARRLAGRSAHPEHIVVAPLDIEGMVIHQAVHDFIRLRTAVKDVADDVEMINNEPLNQLCHGNDEVLGASDFEDSLDDRLVVCFFVEHLRLFGDQLLDDIAIIRRQGFPHFGAGVFGRNDFADVDHLGRLYENNTYTQKHIESVLALDLVDVDAIRSAGFKVAIDCVNSVGGIVIPELLKALGVKDVIELNCTPDGKFPHNPEPLPENLTQIAGVMKEGKADVGFVVDPDVDRLAIVCENGEMFVEEYTLVAVADYVLKHTPGNTVSNLSSSRALRDVTRLYGQQYNASAVGEVNVVTLMKQTGAVIGGEGNGGVIYPASHYGRDALVGIALFLSHLAKEKKTVSQLKASYPAYSIAKQKIQLTPDIDVDALLVAVKEKYAQYDITDIDGVKIDFPDRWVHLRKSNTEPIIRVYSEARTPGLAEETAAGVMAVIAEMTRK